MTLKSNSMARRGIIWGLWNEVEQLRLVHAFELNAHPTPLFSAAITKALINLNSAAALAQYDGNRLFDTESVFAVPKEGDLSALLAYCSAAVRHIDSPKNELNGGVWSFNVLGPGGSMSTNSQVMINEYTDDIAIFWGNTRLYVNRNLLTALARLKSWYPNPF